MMHCELTKQHEIGVFVLFSISVCYTSCNLCLCVYVLVICDVGVDTIGVYVW